MDNITVEDGEKWGLDILTVAMRSKDFGWDNIVEPEKRFILTDLHLYEGKVDVFALASYWRGTGHCEWENLLAAWLIYTVIDALKKGENRADISMLFTRDLIASRDRRFTKGQVYKYIFPSFDIADEDEGNIYLRLRIA